MSVLCKAAFPRVIDLPNRVTTFFTLVGMECPRIYSTDLNDLICKIWFPSSARDA